MMRAPLSGRKGITAVGGAGRATPVLGTISDLDSAAGDTLVVLTWTAATNATSHQPQSAIASSGSWSDFGSPLGGSATGVTVTGLTNDQAYDFRVVAGNGVTTTNSNTETNTPAAPPASGDDPATPATVDIYIGLASTHGASDSNNGLTSGTPKLTYAAAIAIASAGDRIGWLPGTYTAEASFPRYDTTLGADEYIFLTPASGNGTVTFDAQHGAYNAGTLGGRGGVVEGFNIVNLCTGLVAGSIGFSISGTDVIFRRNWVDEVWGSGQNNLGGVVIQQGAVRPIVEHNAWTGLTNPNAIGSNVNVYYLLQWGAVSAGSPVTQNSTIRYNYFQYDARDGQCCLRSKHSGIATGNEIYGNTFVNTTGTEDGTELGTMLDGSDLELSWRVHHNLFINCQANWAEDLGARIEFDYNTCYNYRNAISVRTAPNEIHHNIVMSWTSAWNTGNGWYNVRYNHYGGDTGYANAVAGDVWDYNCYWCPNVSGGHRITYYGDAGTGTTGGVYSLSQFQALVTGFDANSIEEDPDFTDVGTLDFTVGNANASGFGCYQTGYDPPLTAAAALGW